MKRQQALSQLKLDAQREKIKNIMLLRKEVPVEVSDSESDSGDLGEDAQRIVEDVPSRESSREREEETASAEESEVDADPIADQLRKELRGIIQKERAERAEKRLTDRLQKDLNPSTEVGKKTVNAPVKKIVARKRAADSTQDQTDKAGGSQLAEESVSRNADNDNNNGNVSPDNAALVVGTPSYDGTKLDRYKRRKLMKEVSIITYITRLNINTFNYFFISVHSQKV